jgi:transposase-like protein
MPYRHYPDQQKQQILDHLRTNQGDIALTAAETNVPERTLARWRREAGIEPPAIDLPTTPPSPPHSTVHYINDDAILDALRDSQAQMLALMQKLLNTIPQAIDVAPLNQQVAALAQLTDRVIRLAAQLPPKDKDATNDRPLSAIFPPDLLEILDTRPDHTPSESDPDPAE